MLAGSVCVCVFVTPGRCLQQQDSKTDANLFNQIVTCKYVASAMIRKKLIENFIHIISVPCLSLCLSVCLPTRPPPPKCREGDIEVPIFLSPSNFLSLFTGPF